MDEEYDLILMVIPKDEFEDTVARAENWALIGDSTDFDTASGRMGLIEENWQKISD